MDKTLRSILWILVGLVMLSSFSTGWFFVAKERLYNDYLDLETLFKTSMDRLNRELVSSNKKVIELGTKLEAVKKDLSALESKDRLLESRYDRVLSEKEDLDRELTRVKNAKFFIEKRLKDMESETFLASLLKEKVSLEVELKRLRTELAPKDLEIERFKKDVVDLNATLSQAKEEKDFLERRIEDSTEVAEILSKDLLREKDRKKQRELEFENTKVENRILKTKIADLGKIANEYKRLVAEKEDVNDKMARLERELERKDQKLAGLKFDLAQERGNRELRAEAYHSPAEVELPPIILERKGHAASKVSASPLERITERSSLNGRIVTVNRKHNFVVIDIGRQHGIDIGSDFNVYRGSILIGSIEVIQVRERIAACDMKYVEEGFRIEIDDIVAR